MLYVLNILLLLVCLLVLLPVVVFVGECLLGVLSRHRRIDYAALRRPRVAVLVPAHDEEAGIAATVDAVRAQLEPQDRLVVVADNCHDGTAAVAAAHGALVLERTDAQRRGKGYALDHGIKQLSSDPPEVLFVVDADCWLLPGTIDHTSRLAVHHHCPVQATNLLEPPLEASPKDRISSFAFTVKTLARQLGLQRLGMPCHLMGTGMALPWDLVHNAPLASGNIVEDVQLGIDLMLAGHAPRLCLDAGVRGRLTRGTSALNQRKRWEHGHMDLLVRQAPRLLLSGLCHGRLMLVMMALDLCVPPLSLLMGLWVLLVTATAILWAIGGSWVPFATASGGGLALGLAVIGAWARFARGTMPLHTLLAAPLYAMWKAPVYATFMLRRRIGWVRTDRAGVAPAGGQPQVQAAQVQEAHTSESGVR